MINFSVDYAGLYISWAKTSSSYHGCKGDTIKLIPHYNDRYYLQNCKAITFEKIANHTKYEKPNVPSHLHIFWLNFNKANYSFLHFFPLFGNQIFERMVPGAMSIFFLPRTRWQELGDKFWVGRGMSTNASSQYIFSECKPHKFFPHIVECRGLSENSPYKHSGER